MIQSFTPFTLGTLFTRFIQGAILSLNIRYSEKYLYMMSQPLCLFERWNNWGCSFTIYYVDNPYFGIKLFSKFTLSFYAGWVICTSFGTLLPQVHNLKNIRLYDDTLLWYLLNAFPVILVALRIININFIFPFNTIIENVAHHDQNEYYIANVFRKKHVETAWKLLHDYKLEQGI